MSGIGIQLDEVSPLLDRIGDAATLQGLVMVGARATGSLVREHLFALDRSRHRSGGRHFYGRAARSVNVRAVPQGASISIAQVGIRQRLFGGTIKPGAGKKYLTIPASKESYGKRASEFSDLTYGRAMDERGRIRRALVRRPSTPISYVRRKGVRKIKAGRIRDGEPLFWLVRQVEQQPDPTVLPTKSQLTGSATAAIKRRVLRLAGQDSGGEN